jgi:hypothetical protein
MSQQPASKPTVLIQLDVDPQPSVFDGVVAVDAGVAHLFRHGGVTPDAVRDLVHGAMFTRGPSDLRSTAIFVGGSDVGRAEAVFEAVIKSFFGPFRVSVLFDANGSNTTAAAAVLAASEGMGGSVDGARAAVLAGTGAVGGRVARLLAGLGAEVAIGSRSLDRAKAAADKIGQRLGTSIGAFDLSNLEMSLADTPVVIAAGAAGVQLLPKSIRERLPDIKVLIDLNAVPPLGIGGVEAGDKRTERDGALVWGALGVGGAKMKIHKAALNALFKSNDQILDAEQVFAIGESLA